MKHFDEKGSNHQQHQLKRLKHNKRTNELNKERKIETFNMFQK